MRILMLTSSYPKYPGETTAPFIEEIAAGMVRRGHQVDLVMPFHPELRRTPTDRGVRLHVYRYAPHPSLNIWGYAESLRGDVGLRRAALLAAPLALGASFNALLCRLAAEPYDLLHAHWVLPNGLPAAIAARLHQLPLVVSLHGSDVFLAERAWPLSLAAAAIFRAAGAVTACSSELHQRALRLGAHPANATVIPYGVDSSTFQPDAAGAAALRSELGIAGDTPLIAAIGRLVHKKGFNYLIDAFAALRARHPGAILAIAGYGDLQAELEQQVAARGISGHVRFVGQLERRRVARFIAAADVYCVPSVRDQAGNIDGLPNTLLEGMGSGRPIVASRVAGIPDVIDDQQHGLLVPERDSVALAAAIDRLLSDRSFAARLGEQARRRVQHELTWDVACTRFEAAYRQALGI